MEFNVVRTGHCVSTLLYIIIRTGQSATDKYERGARYSEACIFDSEAKGKDRPTGPTQLIL